MSSHRVPKVSTDTPSSGPDYLPKGHGHNAKVRLLTLDHIDGRTKTAVAIRSFEKQLTTDLGDDLTAAQQSLVRRGAVWNAIMEDAEAKWASGEPLVLSDYATCTNTLRRLLLSLGLHRTPRSVNGDRLATLLED